VGGDGLAALDAEQARQALVALTRSAAAEGQPFILALDQVDNLDPEQFGALARFLEALLDAAPNLLVVTAGVQASLVRWREDRVVQDSGWDRLGQDVVQLQKVTVEEATAIVRARLGAFFAPFEGVDNIREARQDDPLFPLGRAWHARALAGAVELRPRDALTKAREGWRLEQEQLETLGWEAWLRTWEDRQGAEPAPRPGPTEAQVRAAVDCRVGAWVDGHAARRKATPGDLPPDADNLAGLLFALLRQCQAEGATFGLVNVTRLPRPRGSERPTYDLDVTRRGPDGVESRCGVAVVAEVNAIAVAGLLRRLIRDRSPFDRLLLVGDERLGLPLGERGREFLAELQQAGPGHFVQVSLGLDEYAYLDALVACEGEARQGGLDVEAAPGQVVPIRPADVLASHRRQGRYRASALLRELLAPAAAATESTAKEEALVP
jgi:hypothetical protein